jgi:hypothetical protein
MLALHDRRDSQVPEHVLEYRPHSVEDVDALALRFRVQTFTGEFMQLVDWVWLIFGPRM